MTHFATLTDTELDAAFTGTYHALVAAGCAGLPTAALAECLNALGAEYVRRNRALPSVVA